jgi:hypothetical protein
MPVNIRATGIVTKSLKIAGKSTKIKFNRFLKKTAILETSHIIRKVLQSET